jgi:alpha-ketoglutarate-dependent taurine dioxygenase
MTTQTKKPISTPEGIIIQTGFPTVITPSKPQFREKLEQIITEHLDWFSQLQLAQGALLFRGFTLEDTTDFEAVVKAFGQDLLDYVGGISPRSRVKGKVYNSTEYPPYLYISPHNEMSYLNSYPKKIYFFCGFPPSTGGETPLVDCLQVTQQLSDVLMTKCQRYGLQSHRTYLSTSPLKGTKTWQDAFETQDKSVIEEFAKQSDLTLTWHENDALTLSSKIYGVIEHPETQESIWFNQAHLQQPFLVNQAWWVKLGYRVMNALFYRAYGGYYRTTYGNGDKISKKDLLHINRVIEKNKVCFTWRKGDFLALDNILVAHGREPFNGKRQILTAMT